MSDEKSTIGRIINNEYHLRGQAITKLIENMDFVSAIWLAWNGGAPNDAERKLLNACLVACIDHGAEPPSAQVARVVASCGKPLADAVAAGILTLGPRHGNAAGEASAWVREAVVSGQSASDIVKSVIGKKQRLAGFGHPQYQVDPRTTKLSELVKTTLPSTRHFDFALEVARELSAQKGKLLPLNVDGAIGAIIADLGAPADLADAVFITARTVGLVAHSREEAEQSVKYRRG